MISIGLVQRIAITVAGCILYYRQANLTSVQFDD